MLPRRAVAGDALWLGCCGGGEVCGHRWVLDSIAVTKFRTDAFTSCKQAGKIYDTPVGERFDVVRQGLGRCALLFKTQLALDIRTCRVLSGEPLTAG